MKAALSQMDIKWQDEKFNMLKIEKIIKDAKDENVDLIVFPEMCLTGFTMDSSCFKFSREEIIKWGQSLGRKYNINIGFGYGIKGKEKSQNSFLIVSKSGEILADYMKIHPFSYGEEDKYFEKGDKIINCSINEAKVGIFICYDLRFPEVFQMSSKRADLIIVAANWPESRINHWTTLLKARAIENQCYVLGINRTGEGAGLIYNGNSLVIDPEGYLINKISEDEKLIIADIDIKKVYEIRKNFNIKKDRRENLYRGK